MIRNIQEVARRIQSEFDRLDEEALRAVNRQKTKPIDLYLPVYLSVL